MQCGIFVYFKNMYRAREGCDIKSRYAFNIMLVVWQAEVAMVSTKNENNVLAIYLWTLHP